MRRVHAGEVGEACGWVRRCPAQHVAELRRVGVDGVPGDQELGRKQGDGLAQAVPGAPLETPSPIPLHQGQPRGDNDKAFTTMWGNVLIHDAK